MYPEEHPVIKEMYTRLFFSDLNKPKEKGAVMETEVFVLGETVRICDGNYPEGTFGTVVGRRINPLRDDISYLVWVKGVGAGHKEDFYDYELVRYDAENEECEGCCDCDCGENLTPTPLVEDLHKALKQMEVIADDMAKLCLAQELEISELKADIADLEKALKETDEELDSALEANADTSYVRTQVAATVLAGMLAHGDQTFDSSIITSVDITDRLLKVLRGTR